MSDVVLALGPDGAERVVLRGADLRVEDGETVLLAGLDAQARQDLTALLTGRVRPRYGRVDPGRVRTGRLGDQLAGGDTVVLDAGDAPAADSTAPPLPVRADCAVVVLAGSGWRPGAAPGRYRTLGLTGGQLVNLAPAQEAGVVRLPLDEVRQRAEKALITAGVDAEPAATVSAVLVDADRRGHSSHGIALLPTYLRRIEAGGIVAGAVPRLTALAPTLASVDAGGGFGQPAADLAARWCAATAAQHGLAAAAVHTNNHVGMLAAYRWPFQEHGVVGLVLNTSAPMVAAPGARRATLGSNAICLVTPTASGGEPFCVDLATGVVAAGKIRDAHQRGVRIPDGWLRDKTGTATTDPAQLDRGGSIPLLGGYKGLCITLLAEILAGALAGGRVSPDVSGQVAKPDQVMRCAQLFVGFSVRHLTAHPGRADQPGPVDLDELIDRLREAVLAGHGDATPPRPWFPDQLEEASAAHADRYGIGVSAAVLAELGWDQP
jgi:LDH2 family malate/lactate/ureidoglycolate dehydrogenase